MLKNMVDIKQQEYDLLNEIAQDSMVTQANLSKRLGMAVGSVNWYIKRLIKRGYVKVSHLDRTRLQYDLTPEGMSVFTERAMLYAKDSLQIYKKFRQMAKSIISELKAKEISEVYLEGNDEIMDILRLTCIEAGISLNLSPNRVVLKYIDQEYKIIYHEAN
jgi:DNA-binding MarR family transcriptional regulator